MVPALAVADALRAEGARVVFVGGERAERTLVPEAGYDLRTIAVEGLSRTNPLKAARAVRQGGRGVGTARRILRDVRPDAVMGGGGYVAGPVGLAAVARRIPLVLTEADSHLGLSNRLLARFARRVCLAFPIAGRTGERYLVTGRPVPPPGDRRRRRPRAVRPRRRRALRARVRRVARGAVDQRGVGRGLRRPAARLPRAPRVGHARLRGAARARARRRRATTCAPTSTTSARRSWPRTSAVARAGGSIFEVAAHGRPAILVPYPHATADHQTANARWMADGGAATVIADADLTPERLRAEVDALLADPARLQAMGRASAGLARPDAAQRIAAELLAAA